MYAVVKAGGKQHKVAVGDVVEVNRLEGEAGDAVSLPALLLVDGRTVTMETSALAKIAVTGEIVGHHKGPKIKILKYKNKTGYRRRIGHRQLLTELLVTDIDDGKPKTKKQKKKVTAQSDKSDAAESDAVESDAAEDDAAEDDAAEDDTGKSGRDAKPTEASVKAMKTAPAKAAAKNDADDRPAKATGKANKAAAKAKKAADTTDEKED